MMHCRRRRVGLFAGLLTAGWLSFPIGLCGAEAKVGVSVAGSAAVAEAARAVIAALDESKQGKLLFRYDDEVQRKRWSNLPTGIFERAGVRLGDLTPAQRDAVMKLLRSALSPSGYQKVVGIMEGDETLMAGAGGRIVFGRDEYYLSILGKPSANEPWMIQFGGHHLALNLTFLGDEGTLAPSHTAAQPARFTFEGKTVRPLGGETDRAFELMGSLDEGQRKQAILGAAFRDVVLGPTQEVRRLAPEGVRASGFSPKQKELLLALIREWVGISEDRIAERKMAEVRGNLDSTWFAWSGPTTPGSAAYFRIQGPTVHIEYAPQTLGGDPTQHIHTMFRDPSGEYGRRNRTP